LVAKSQALSEARPVQVGPLRISYNMTPLQAAAFWGQDEVVKALIAKGAEVNARDQFGVTALHIACGSEQDGNDPEHPPYGSRPKATTVRTLLDAGADINAASETGVTPLMVAVGVADVDVVEVLLNRGADVSATADIGNTVLHEALKNSNTAVISLLARKGADVNRGNGIGATPLMIAGYEGREEAVQKLLAAGADPATADNAGFSALDYCEGRPYPLKTGSADSRRGIIAMIKAAIPAGVKGKVVEPSRR
jgi:cytohesin